MSSTRTITVDAVDITLTEAGEGHPILLLHGGGGPQTVAGFAELLAAKETAHVVTPTHPGFGGTTRPEVVADVRSLAALYGRLLDELDLVDVTVVGNSIGGWIAAEMALLHSPRISSVVLVDAAGLEVPEHPMVDFFSLTMEQVTQLSWHNPAAATPIDVTALPPAVQAIFAGNRSALATYGGVAMADPSLRDRLAAAVVPTLVLWGESDEIVVPEVGRAYAAAIPGAVFELLTETGHVPQLETPDQLLRAVWTFAEAHATNKPTV